ncbi:hypothetical protein FisN_3Hh065 [Fistulifera solaris]|jgi:hypothetical protein|uniref:Ubiquitin-like domain-containing protein n=1 Tax=Fistulifera solaris TaxID=1519565 RepID=A0A1Z5JNI9_FISSO|nr:hypothetical protein FisN_3Hh065 [Fistulifera solaris]|eukprot:GAX15595.1 hypothetical protein FisN_3Hh065 [Fistulifera solaris]
MRNQRRRYNPVASHEEGANEETESEVIAEETEESSRTEGSLAEEDVSVASIPAPRDDFEVTILDFAQTKFSVPASPQWTIAQLMQAGTVVHKVSPSRQRLIFRGKLLADGEKTLQDYGINETGMIVHLFPKPRVVITNQNNNETNEPAVACEETNNEENGAHIPTIVMDASEAERRAEILVLGSPDFIEAQNNVKLFSFMLLLISSIELLNLMGVAMGVPQTEQLPDGGEPGNYLDDFFPQEPVNVTVSNQSMEEDAAANLYNHWGWPQTVDTFVSCLGIYVALIGLRASTENTVRLARQYMLGLFAAGGAWLMFNFFFMATVEEQVEEQREQEHSKDKDFTPMSDSDIYSQSLQVMVLPGIVWFMCWMRAWHFHHLLREADEEANERLRSQTRDYDEANVNHDEELALSSGQAVLT